MINISRRNRVYIFLTLLLLLLVSTVFVWSIVLSKSGSGVLTVAFLDVGQGDSIFIEAPNGSQMLIDGGRGRAVLRGLGKVMHFYDRSIDVVLATHPDMDHIGGLPEVFKRYKVANFIESGVHDDGADNLSLHHAVEKEGLKPVYARQGMRVVLDEDVTAYILFPDRDVSYVDPNTGSIVVKLVYKDVSFLLTGDSPVSIEKYLTVLYGEQLKSDVLKLGHHGSRTSSSEILLSAVYPKYAVISAGCHNHYGHPHKEVLERLEHLKIEKVSTCKSGTIIFKSDGKEVWKL